MILFLFLAQILFAATSETKAAPTTRKIDVPAIFYTTEASHPCNIAPKGDGFATPAVCITGPEEHWACQDLNRVMLRAENGTRHCISFDLIEETTRN